MPTMTSASTREPVPSAESLLTEWATTNGYTVKMEIEHDRLPRHAVMLHDKSGALVYWATALTMETACKIAHKAVTEHPWTLKVCKPPKLRLGDIADPKERARCKGDSVGESAPRECLKSVERVVECAPQSGVECAPLFGEQRL